MVCTLGAPNETHEVEVSPDVSSIVIPTKVRPAPTSTDLETSEGDTTGNSGPCYLVCEKRRPLAPLMNYDLTAVSAAKPGGSVRV